ncbi:MAG: glutamate--tRNA ligase [Syntrophorhabdus aromaticivorans]|uniref:Glutamate--tRNA ligase n=1 Tax=Syntrophorhabdus aromaticivorans TaxID=328301 RepID=A0A971M5Z9_9BACT|nr:glutamate--tRNA ligase [Syntrophorhabdus aromaticivorans]
MVKVRFAPSPTGNLHVGNARTAILNYLYARNQGGSFIVRMEDTDMERSDVKYETSILDDLKWLGITWDEGPYRQSGRLDLYRAHAQNLLDKGVAYKCFCSKDRLEAMKKASLDKGEPPRYDGACRELSRATTDRLEAEGASYVVRFKAQGKAVTFKDGIRGDIHFPPDHVDDFILLKQELTPSYNFAVIIDDVDMGITHVIRGADHISNTPKQIMLCEALRKKPPRYAHHSLLAGKDKKPLSKRHGATRVGEFRDMGILRSALFNYIAVIGRSVHKEVMDEGDLIKTFSLKSLSGSDCLFDMEKLLWFNKEHMRRMSVEDLLAGTGLGADYSDRIALLRENARTLGDMKELLDIFDGTDISHEGMAYLETIASPAPIIAGLRKALLDGRESTFEEIVNKTAGITNLTRRELFMVLRILITGRVNGPPLKDVFRLIPRDHILERLQWSDQRLSLH